MSDTQREWTERNGETTPPTINENECKWFWFEGRASYDDWQQRGAMTVIGDTHTDRVIGLVFVMMMPDMRHPKRDEHGRYVYDRPAMLAVPETIGYDLNRCVGKWYGPVEVPHFEGGDLLSLAHVEDYAEWKAFEDAYNAERSN